MRAISSGACPVDSRFGSTFGLAICGSSASSSSRYGRVGVGLGQPRVERAIAARAAGRRDRVARSSGARTRLDAQHVGERVDDSTDVEPARGRARS